MAKKQAKVAGVAPEAKPQESHRAKDPEIVTRSQKLFEVLAKFGKYMAIVFVVFSVGYFGYKNHEPKQAQKPQGVAQIATTGVFCWYETEKGTGWYKNTKKEIGCFGAKILEHDQTHLLVKYTDQGVSGTCDWDKLKDPQYGEWKETGRNNGGDCMLTQVENKLFTGFFISHYDTKGRYIPGYRDKYYVELRLN